MQCILKRASWREFAGFAYDCAVFYSSLLVLGMICLSWTVLALPLYVLLPQRLGTVVGRSGIMAGFRIYTSWLSLVRAYRLDLSAIDALRGGPALILAPNHPVHDRCPAHPHAPS